VWQTAQPIWLNICCPTAIETVSGNRGGGQKTREIRRGIDIRFARVRLNLIFRIPNVIELLQQVSVAVWRVFRWEESAGDPYFVEIRVACERQQGRLLGFPAETAYACPPANYIPRH